VRARPGAPVATPLEWEELKSLKAADQFTMKDALERVESKKQDVFSRRGGQTLPAS
jgi:DNA primase